MRKSASPSLAPSGRGLSAKLTEGECGHLRRNNAPTPQAFTISDAGSRWKKSEVQQQIYGSAPAFSLSRLRATAPSRREPEICMSKYVKGTVLLTHLNDAVRCFFSAAFSKIKRFGQEVKQQQFLFVPLRFT